MRENNSSENASLVNSQANQHFNSGAEQVRLQTALGRYSHYVDEFAIATSCLMAASLSVALYNGPGNAVSSTNASLIISTGISAAFMAISGYKHLKAAEKLFKLNEASKPSNVNNPQP